MIQKEYIKEIILKLGTDYLIEERSLNASRPKELEQRDFGSDLLSFIETYRKEAEVHTLVKLYNEHFAGDSIMKEIQLIQAYSLTNRKDRIAEAMRIIFAEMELKLALNIDYGS